MKIKNADGEWIDIHDIPTSPMSSQTHKVPMPGIGMICVAIGVHFPPSRWVPLRWRTLRLRESTRELGRRGARWVGSSPQLGSLVCHCAGPYATRTDRTQHIRPRDSTNERGGATTAPTWSSLRRNLKGLALTRHCHFMSVCHSPFGCVDRFSGLAVADLVSR